MASTPATPQLFLAKHLWPCFSRWSTLIILCCYINTHLTPHLGPLVQPPSLISRELPLSEEACVSAKPPNCKALSLGPARGRECYPN